MERARSGGGPTLIEAKVTRLTAHSSDDQETKYRSEDDLAEGRAQDPLPIFRTLLRDGGMLTDELEATLASEISAEVEDATDHAEAEIDADPSSAWTGCTRIPRPASRRRPGIRPARAPAGAGTDGHPHLIEAVREGLAEEMRRDGSIIVLGEDVGKKGGVFLATDGLWAEFGDDRVIDTPLTESMIIGASIGAAMNGLRPIAEIQFADFIHPAFNQLVSEAARMRYRTNNGFGVPMVVRAPYGGGVHGALYHSQSVEAFFTHVPGLKVVIPSTPYDAKGLLKSSIRDEDPVLFFEHKKMYRSVRGDVPAGDFTVPLGRAAVRRPGKHVTWSRTGSWSSTASRRPSAWRRRASRSRSIDLRTLRPLDRQTLLGSVRKTGKCLVAYEDNRFGGYGAEIAAIVAEEAFEYLDGPVSRIAGPDVPGVPYNHALEDWFMLSPAKIADAVRKLAAY